MGTMLSSKLREHNKSIVEVILTSEESLQLRGHVDGIQLASTDASCAKTKIASRGNKEATKYFLIPKEFRKKLVSLTGEVRCQKTEMESKVVFIYSLPRKEWIIPPARKHLKSGKKGYR